MPERPRVQSGMAGRLSASLLFLALAWLPAMALDPDKAVTQYMLSAWDTEDGLPQNSVQAIVQAHDGYLWLGTQEGLVRFDGVSFKVFDKRNNPEMKASRILSLFEDREENLWVGTLGGGLIRLKGGVFTTFSTKEGLCDDLVFAICQDRLGDLWIGTRGGLNRFRQGRFEKFTTKDGLLRDRVQSLLEDREGNLWIGTYGGGVNLFRDGKMKSFTPETGLSDGRVMSLCQDRAGDLWVGTDGGGLNRFHDGRFTVYNKKDGLSSDTILALHEDRDGNLWVGTEGGGLCRLRGGRFESFASKDGLPSDMIRSFSEDAEGSLWVGTFAGGLCRLRDGKFTVTGASEGLTGEMVTLVYQDSQRNLWIGTYNEGLNRLKDGKVAAFTSKNGLSSNMVTSILEDQKGDIWIGTNNGGLNRFSGGKFTSYSVQDGLPSNKMAALCEDGEGNLWAGTSDGLCRMKDGRFTTYTMDDGLLKDIILCLRRSADGSLWIGTNGGGLSHFKDGKFTNYTTKEGLSKNIVVCIYEDTAGTLWLSTYGGGLTRFKGGKFQTFTTREGLADDLIYQILEDDRQDLWMSSNKGIFRVSKTDIESFANGAAASISCVHYGQADGMRSAECNGGFQPAGWKTKEGDLWFPTIKGAVMINPSRIRINTIPPPVVAEQVVVDNHPFITLAKLAFAPASKSFDFHYTALSFLAPEKVRFRYKLEGFDQEWREAGTRRTAYYTNLAPGDYRFRVIACNDDGIWNEAGASLDFHLRPHFYQTLWFYALCTLSVLLAAWAAYRIRVGQLKARERELVRFVDERTMELRENQRKLLISEKMASLGRLSAGIAHEMNTPLAAVRSSHAELKKLVEEYEASLGSPDVNVSDHHEIAKEMHHSLKLADSAAEQAIGFVRSVKSQTRDMNETEKRLFDAVPVIRDAVLLLNHALKKGNCTVSIECPEHAELTGSPARLAQVVTNLVLNAVEASAGKGGGAITLRFEQGQGALELTVSDHGCGIPEENLSRIFDPMFTTKRFGEAAGLGLTIAHDIVTGEFGGSISVSSKNQEGATFSARLPNSSRLEA